MWHAIELQCRAFQTQKPESLTKRVIEKLVNDEDVFVNQLNLDCIIFHPAQTKILLYHQLLKKQKNVTVLTVNTHSLIRNCGLRTCWRT